MKKLIAIFIIVLFMFQCVLFVGAVEMNTQEEFIIHDTAKHERIDELFALRSSLETDFQNNTAQINEIDQELQLLGVEVIPYESIGNSGNNGVQPAASFEGNDSNTQWTSRRMVVTYRGQHYELQIIEGVPLNEDSGLRRNDVEVSFDASGIVAGATEVIDIIGTTALEGIPVIGEFIHGVTLLSMCAEAIGDSFATSTVIENVNGVAMVSFASHIKYVFVKGYGSSDSYQLLGYFGNAVTINISTIMTVDGPVGEHGSLPVHLSDINNYCTVYAEYFDDYTIATKNYYNYRNNINEPYVCEFLVRYIRLEIFETERNFEVPLQTPSITV